MKELEKTKRISIATVLTILVLLIALLAYRRPKNTYKITTKSTLENITHSNYFISLDKVNTTDYILIDIRSQFEFEKGHIEKAINIYTPEILKETNLAVFKEVKQDNKTVLLYGSNPNETITPFMVLYQLGYDNIKILTVKNSYSQNKLITANVAIENSETDINAFIEQSVKKVAKLAKVKAKPKIVRRAPKKVIKVKKKKKMPVEGGC